jgi:hypothetical protein
LSARVYTALIFFQRKIARAGLKPALLELALRREQGRLRSSDAETYRVACASAGGLRESAAFCRSIRKEPPMKSRAGNGRRRNAASQAHEEDRFGEGTSHEGERIVEAIAEGAAAPGSSPQAEEIARRAYQRYLAREQQGEAGSPEQDWLAAEEELRRS